MTEKQVVSGSILTTSTVCELNLSSLVTYHGEKTTSTRRILDMIDAKRTAGQILGEPFRGKKQGNNFNLAIYDRKPSP